MAYKRKTPRKSVEPVEPVEEVEEVEVAKPTKAKTPVKAKAKVAPTPKAIVPAKPKNLMGTSSKLISNIVRKAEKSLGDESVRLLGDKTVSSKVKYYIPSGNSELNKALGLPGLPVGRVINIYGAEASGKTTIAQSVAAQCQIMGGVVIYVDTEFALDPTRAVTLGLDVEEVIILQPETAEEACKSIEEMVKIVRNEDVDVPIVVVWDSVASSPTAKELAEGKAQVGELARIMSSHLRVVRGLISKSNVCAIYVNQTREKIGVMFGDTTALPGGKALPFYSSIMLEVKRVGQIKEGDNVVGNKTRVIVKKNKLAAPFKRAEFAIMFDTGITEDIASLFEMAANAEIIYKKGKKYAYVTDDGEEVLFTKKEWKDVIENHEEIREKITDSGGIAPVAEDDEDDE